MKPVSMSFETGFIVLFIGTLSATTEQNKGFTFNIAPFFVFLSPKMEVRLTLDSKKAISNFKKRLFLTSKEPYLIMGRMLLKLRHDVAVTASGRSCCYVVT